MPSDRALAQVMMRLIGLEQRLVSEHIRSIHHLVVLLTQHCRSVLRADGTSHAATLPASRSMHLCGYYVLAPWSDVCIILRMLPGLGRVLERLLAENILRLGGTFDRVLPVEGA